MKRSFHAELLKLRRPSILFGAGAVLPLLALLSTIVTFATATKTRAAGSGFGPASLLSSFDQLSRAGGLTHAFQVSAGFIGILVFVFFTVNVASEYTHGTMRSLLMWQPQRGRLFAGKLLALLVATAAALLVALIVSGAASMALAHLRGIPTSNWFGAAGLEAAARDYGNAVLGITLFALFGATIASLTRSTVLAVSLGIAWMMPLEHIIQAAWQGAGRWFPGLLISAISLDGTSIISYQRALLTAVAYTVAVGAVGAVSVLRRDVA